MSIKKKFLKCLFLILISFNGFAKEPESKILSKKDLKLIEEKVDTELKGKNLTTEKKFYLNLLAARELYQFRYYDQASHYYKNALAMNVSENKTEAYINLMAIEITRGHKDKVRDLYTESKEYFAKNPHYKTTEIDYYLKTIEAYLPGQKNNKSQTPIAGFYGRFAHEENLINLIKEKEYLKAFSLLNPEGVAHSTNDFNITAYDALNVLINGRTVKELYCNKQYTQYPDAFAMSTIICSLLNDHLKDGKFSEKHLKMANLYFGENSEKKYMFEMVKDIK